MTPHRLSSQHSIQNKILKMIKVNATDIKVRAMGLPKMKLMLPLNIIKELLSPEVFRFMALCMLISIISLKCLSFSNHYTQKGH